MGAIVISKRNRFDRIGYKTMLRAERSENFFGLSHICDILTARYWKMKSKICQINLFSQGRNWSSFATDLKLFCFSEPTRERGRRDVVMTIDLIDTGIFSIMNY